MRVALFPTLLILAAAPVHAENDPILVTTAYLEGVNASATMTEAWEAALAKHPDQPDVRERAIGYYSQPRFTDAAAKERYIAHVLYVIGHYPESPYASRSASILLFASIDGAAAFDAAHKLWRAAVDSKPEDGHILANAADFLQFEEKAEAERILNAGLKLEPNDAAWSVRLGRFHLNQTTGAADSGAKYAAASKALKELERAAKLMPTEDERLQIMDELVRSSYMVNRTDKTAEYARLWMKEVPVGRWDFANAQHYGHTALGLIALNAKDLKGATNELALSAGHSGSPQLNSFGPCMDLAAALSAQGQNDAVIDYLEACGKFWTSGAGKLSDWTKAVKSGIAPDFSGHLSF